MSCSARIDGSPYSPEEATAKIGLGVKEIHGINKRALYRFFQRISTRKLGLESSWMCILQLITKPGEAGRFRSYFGFPPKLLDMQFYAFQVSV